MIIRVVGSRGQPEPRRKKGPGERFQTVADLPGTGGRAGQVEAGMSSCRPGTQCQQRAVGERLQVDSAPPGVRRSGILDELILIGSILMGLVVVAQRGPPFFCSWS
jgi:hypothetical protein